MSRLFRLLVATTLSVAGLLVAPNAAQASTDEVIVQDRETCGEKPGRGRTCIDVRGDGRFITGVTVTVDKNTIKDRYGRLFFKFYPTKNDPGVGRYVGDSGFNMWRVGGSDTYTWSYQTTPLQARDDTQVCGFFEEKDTDPKWLSTFACVKINW